MRGTTTAIGTARWVRGKQVALQLQHLIEGLDTLGLPDALTRARATLDASKKATVEAIAIDPRGQLLAGPLTGLRTPLGRLRECLPGTLSWIVDREDRAGLLDRAATAIADAGDDRCLVLARPPVEEPLRSESDQQDQAFMHVETWSEMGGGSEIPSCMSRPALRAGGDQLL